MDLSQEKSNYKFNEKGEPIQPGVKKSSSKKKKKRSEPPEVSECGSADSCAEKKSEAKRSSRPPAL